MVEQAEAVTVKHAKWRDFWEKRAMSSVDYVGRLGEPTNAQTLKIESLLKAKIPPAEYYPEGIDFGCGPGRFIPFLSNHCGHVWAVDLVSFALKQAKQRAMNVSVIEASCPLKLPWKDRRIGFLWAGLVFQHIVDEDLFMFTVTELSRVLSPGARVLILDNGVDIAKHVKPRGPDVLAGVFKLRGGWTATKVTINNRPNDHWLIDGRAST
jgi:SAM-dependent methyltransferase